LEGNKDFFLNVKREQAINNAQQGITKEKMRQNKDLASLDEPENAWNMTIK
jgi:hypothetical protein